MIWPRPGHRRRQTDGDLRVMVDETNIALEPLLAEYNSLRNESLRTIDNRIVILNFTFGALSIIIAGLLSRAAPEVVSGLIGLLLVPQVAKAGLLIWLGEYQRSLRANRWLVRLEGQINDLVGSPRHAIGWESALSDKSVSGPGPSRLSYPYVATVFFCLAAGYAGGVVGVTLLSQAIGSRGIPGVWIAVIAVALSVYFLVVEFFFLRFFRSKWSEVRSMGFNRIPDGEPA